MKSLRRRDNFVWLMLILMLVFILMTSIACETSFKLVIENRTTQVLTVYVYRDSIGTIDPGKQISRAMSGMSIDYLITAKNSQGEVIFSKTLTLSEMEYLGNDTFKVVISSVQNK